GYPCSVGLVAGLMRELGLRACQPRAYKRTTVPGEQPPASPDLIGRDFTAAAPGQRLVGDITYLRTGEGWLYLATVIDLATKMVTGWQLAEHMRTSLSPAPWRWPSPTATSSPAPSSTAIGAVNTARPSSPGSARRTGSAPASGEPACAGITPPP